jgi:tetratricopeptide (TPR) repeat protein
MVMKMKLAALIIILLAVFAMPAVADDVDKLIQDLNDPSPSVRGAAAGALRELNDTRAVEPLTQALKDEDSYVRQYAAESLGMLNDTRAVEPLKSALNDKNGYVRKAAADALAKLGWMRAEEDSAVAVHQRDFVFEKWGAYNFEDSSGTRYFTGYVQEPTEGMEGSLTPLLWEKSKDKSLMDRGLASEVLIDQSEEGTISKSMPLNLSDGYQLRIMSIDTVSKKAYLELTRYGEPVDSKALNPKFDAPMEETTYYYRADLGSAKDIVQIAVHFKNVFATSDNNLGTYDGVFQISSSPISYALLNIDVPSSSVSSSITSTEPGAVKSAEDWFNEGVALDDQGNYADAIKAYDEAVKLDPNYAEAWYNNGNALYRQGKYDESIKAFNEAIKAYDEAIKQDPNDANLCYGKGNALNARGKYDDAIKAYDEAIRLDPNYAEAWNNKGEVLRNQGKYDDAIKCNDEAIRLDPNDAKAWNNKGLTLNAQGKYDDAIKCYDEAIRLDPNLFYAWTNKSNALYALGRTTEASAAIAKAADVRDAAFAKAKELGV